MPWRRREHRYRAGGFDESAGRARGRSAVFFSMAVTPALRSATSLMRRSERRPEDLRDLGWRESVILLEPLPERVHRLSQRVFEGATEADRHHRRRRTRCAAS